MWSRRRGQTAEKHGFAIPEPTCRPARWLPFPASHTPSPVLGPRARSVFSNGTPAWP